MYSQNLNPLEETKPYSGNVKLKRNVAVIGELMRRDLTNWRSPKWGSVEYSHTHRDF